MIKNKLKAGGDFMSHSSDRSKIITLLIFGTFFGFDEAAVVVYLRDLINFHSNYILTGYRVILNLGFITFTTPIHSLFITDHVAVIEVLREIATIIMLFTIAYLVGQTRKQRIGAFLISFGCWDIMYYVFLKLIDNWPNSLLSKDVYFLVPITWIGPVLTPIIFSIILLIIGIKLFIHQPKLVKAE